jgi:hypothetical protein
VLTSIEPAGSAPVGEAPPPLSKDAIKAIGSKCPDRKCASGLTCVEYFGIAGPSGPKFTSCEVRCGGSACPGDLKCVTIADGPGAVCRP